MVFIFRSWQLGWMITLSLVIHEIGHIFIVSRYGIDWELGFNVLGAWIRTPRQDRKALGDYDNSLIHLAGPFFSLFLALILTIIYYLLPSANRIVWLEFANFNALVCLLNLLPMGDLSDGGKFVRRLFSSADETLEERLLALVGVLPLIFACIILAYRLDWARLLSLLSIVLWFVLTMLVESRLDDPKKSASPNAMSPGQSRNLLSGMILMLLISMGLATLTPFWLTPENIRQMLFFFSSILP